MHEILVHKELAHNQDVGLSGLSAQSIRLPVKTFSWPYCIVYHTVAPLSIELGSSTGNTLQITWLTFSMLASPLSSTIVV